MESIRLISEIVAACTWKSNLCNAGRSGLQKEKRLGENPVLDFALISARRIKGTARETRAGNFARKGITLVRAISNFVNPLRSGSCYSSVSRLRGLNQSARRLRARPLNLQIESAANHRSGDGETRGKFSATAERIATISERPLNRSNRSTFAAPRKERRRRFEGRGDGTEGGRKKSEIRR